MTKLTDSARHEQQHWFKLNMPFRLHKSMWEREWLFRHSTLCFGLFWIESIDSPLMRFYWKEKKNIWFVFLYNILASDDLLRFFGFSKRVRSKSSSLSLLFLYKLTCLSSTSVTRHTQRCHSIFIFCLFNSMSPSLCPHFFHSDLYGIAAACGLAH